ncbi:MAG TPA: DUF2231 domain-containing protein [Gemmatimonadaceae bacterium]|nr:DUF2231 domain-containing protein [Gemmatimonadaceae bacterium]
MPTIGQFHPQIVHFAVALLFAGVVARLISLTGKLKFTDHGAATLLIAGAIAALLAVKSGTDAHGPVERIPGAREAVIEHEELGERARNIFLVVAALEVIALGLARGASSRRFVRLTQVASAVVGIVGSFQLYEAAEHGGELVYSYGGGPGLRTGNPQDVERLLLAGLYNQSREDRKAKRPADAAALVDLMVKRYPNDTTIRFLHVESLLLDSKDYPRALAAVDSISLAPTDGRLRARQATLKADIYLALGKPDSARAALAPVVEAFPQNTRLKAKLDSIK